MIINDLQQRITRTTPPMMTMFSQRVAQQSGRQGVAAGSARYLASLMTAREKFNKKQYRFVSLATQRQPKICLQSLRSIFNPHPTTSKLPTLSFQNRSYNRAFFHTNSYTMVEELVQPTITPTEDLVVDCIAWFLAFFACVWIPTCSVGDEFTTNTDQLDYQSLEEMEDEADRQYENKHRDDPVRIKKNSISKQKTNTTSSATSKTMKTTSNKKENPKQQRHCDSHQH